MKLTNLRKGYQTLLNAFIIASAIFISPLSAQKPSQIYVLQIIQHPALDASRQGIYDALIDAGYVEGDDFIWNYSNAQGNITLAAQMAQSAAGAQADVIVTLGTSVTQAAMAANKSAQIPIVFASVTDPVGSRIVESMEKPGGAITGVSNLTPAEPQFELFKKLQPQLKTLGVIYNPGEANSQALIEDMKAAALKVGIELAFATASKTSDVPSAAAKLAKKADAFYVNNDNTALSAFESIVKVGLHANKPAYVSDTDLVEQGALAALGPNQYLLGKQVGTMVMRILNGEKPKDIPVEYAKDRETKINDTMPAKLGIVIEK